MTSTDLAELTEYRVTFGTLRNPQFPEAHPDGWLGVLATDDAAARRATHAAIGPGWATIYAPHEADYPKVTGGSYPFPRGRLAMITPDDELGYRWLRGTDRGTWEPRPIVWAFCVGVWPHGDQAWLAISDDGEPITQHISSSRAWGVSDVAPRGSKIPAYLEVLGTVEVDYRVVPESEAPPEHVKERAIAAGHMSRPAGEPS